MWVPNTFAEVEAAVGIVAEGPELDFKSAFSSNAETAKDLAAMTVLGGVLVYGVAENDGVASELTPVELAGAAERINQIASTAIRPPPAVDVVLHEDPDRAGRGLVVVVVPASPAAPHYANERFPARAGVTTRYLTESEIADLYGRRFAFAESDASRRAHLERFMTPENGLQVDAGFGGIAVLRLLISPLIPAHRRIGLRLDEPLGRAVAAATQTLNPLVSEQIGFMVLERLDEWAPRGTIGWKAGAAVSDFNQLRDRPHAACTYTYDGSLSFLVTRTTIVQTPEGEERSAFEHLWLLDLMSCLSAGGHFFAEIFGGGLLVVQLTLAGLEGAASHLQTDGRLFGGNLPRVTDNAYVASGEYWARELAEEPAAAADGLLERLFVSFLPVDTDVHGRLREARRPEDL